MDVQGLVYLGVEEGPVLEARAWKDSSSSLSHSHGMHRRGMIARETAGDEVGRIAYVTGERYCIDSAGSFHHKCFACVGQHFVTCTLQARRVDRTTDSQTDDRPCHRCSGASCRKPVDCRYSAADTVPGRMTSGPSEMPDGDGSLPADSGTGTGASTARLVGMSHTAATAALARRHNTTIDSDFDLEPAPAPGSERSCWRRRQH